MFDKILFRPPNPPSYNRGSFPAKLCNLNGTLCVALRAQGTSRYLAIYCHSNASDVGLIKQKLEVLSYRLRMHVLIVEYPGYGLSEGIPNQKAVDECLSRVVKFAHESLQWPKENILLFGRSIGTGPVIKFASTEKVGGLILISPFTSIRSLIELRFGKMASIFQERWNSLENIAKITCPILFLHGSDDQLIPSNQSNDLYRACSSKIKHLHIFQGATHNRFDWALVTSKIGDFLRCKMVEQSMGRYQSLLVIPRECYEEWGNLGSKKSCQKNLRALSKAHVSKERTLQCALNTMGRVLSETGTGGIHNHSGTVSKEGTLRCALDTMGRVLSYTGTGGIHNHSGTGTVEIHNHSGTGTGGIHNCSYLVPPSKKEDSETGLNGNTSSKMALYT